MQAIGGYFSLELPIHKEYHTKAIKLNTGRNCLEYILRCKNYRKVYIPFYTCEVVLEPFKKLEICYSYYHIDNNLEIAEDIQLSEGEALLYTNYFGLKQSYVRKLAKLYSSQLIIDNTQAFFDMPVEGIDTFYTCRKFFGVPDGAYLYTDSVANFEIPQDFSYNRMDFLLKRIDISPEDGYADFRQESSLLVGQPIKKMSKLTERIMQSIDYIKAMKQRRSNYLYFQKKLSKMNMLAFNIDDFATPMIYPFFCKLHNLRSKLIKEKIYVAQYWPFVLQISDSYSFEYEYTNYMHPLPIDQRYDKEDMNRIVSIIEKVYR